MIILFGNQKGGCGKTTNCIQFANYLVEKGKEVLVLDLDFQRSLSDRRKEDIAIPSGGTCCSAWAPARPSRLPSRPLWTTQTQPLPPRHKRYFF